jgi:hypothetical protein
MRRAPEGAEAPVSHTPPATAFPHYTVRQVIAGGAHRRGEAGTGTDAGRDYSVSARAIKTPKAGSIHLLGGVAGTSTAFENRIMIAAAIRPLLNIQVQHWLPPVRDVQGKQAKAGSTTHAARLTHTPGTIITAASRERMADAAATVWLVNHPRPIALGDTFELPTGEALKVIRVERRASGADTISKVFLS